MTSARIQDQRPGYQWPCYSKSFAFIKPGDMPIPDAAQDKLVARGVLFGVCNLAVHVLQRNGRLSRWACSPMQ
jgi:hypothetical protein